MTHLRAAAIVVFKGPVQHCRVRKSLCFQPPYTVGVPLPVDNGFLLFSFSSFAGTFDWMLVLAYQGNAVGKECFFCGMTFAAVKQVVLAIIIFGGFGNTGNRLF